MTLAGGFLFQRLDLGTFLGENIEALGEETKVWWLRAHREYLKIIVRPTCNFVLGLAIVNFIFLFIARGICDKTGLAPFSDPSMTVIGGMINLLYFPLYLFQKGAEYRQQKEKGINGALIYDTETDEPVYFENHPSWFSLPLVVSVIVVVQSCVTGILLAGGAHEHKRVISLLGGISFVIMVMVLASFAKVIAKALDAFVVAIKGLVKYVGGELGSILPSLTEEQIKAGIDRIRIPHISPVVSGALLTLVTSTGFLILDQILYPSVWLLQTEIFVTIVMTGTAAGLILHGKGLTVKLATWTYLAIRFSVVGYLAVALIGWDYADPAIKTDTTDHVKGAWYSFTTFLDNARCVTLSNENKWTIMYSLGALIAVLIVWRYAVKYFGGISEKLKKMGDDSRLFWRCVGRCGFGLLAFVGIFLLLATIRFGWSTYKTGDMLVHSKSSGKVCIVGDDESLPPPFVNQNLDSSAIGALATPKSSTQSDTSKDNADTSDDKGTGKRSKADDADTDTEKDEVADAPKKATDANSNDVADPWSTKPYVAPKASPSKMVDKPKAHRRNVQLSDERPPSRVAAVHRRRASPLWDKEFVSQLEADGH